MASAVKFQDFVEQLGKGKHDFSTHTLKFALSNTTPNATDTHFTDISEISAGNGYSAGGMTLDNVTFTESSGTATLDSDDEALTASGGNIGPFQYVILYNATLAEGSPTEPNLIIYWDIGSPETIADGDTDTFTLSTNLLTIA